LESTTQLAGLIVDLRDNVGGALVAVVEVAEKFLTQGSLITSTTSRVPNQNMRFVAPRQGSTSRLRLPLVVLVNQGSAAGAEIVAGAIQDHRRGLIVGTRTLGMSSIRVTIPMPDGSVLILPTAKFLTPAGRSIDGQGVVPDVVVEPTNEGGQAHTAAERRRRDLPLQRAVERLRGAGS
jgi:carboxyl-terminal processing protease